MSRGNFGAFYYSESMAKLRFGAHAPDNWFKPLIGKPKRYTLWSSQFPYLHKCAWGDIKFLGFGWYHHSGAR